MSLQKIILPGNNRPTTSLGFGGNMLLGPRTRAEGIALLETAYKSGIRHFDVARYYGFGDAEGVVGEFAESRRDDITITTKFGLQPMKNVARMRGLIQIARRIMRLSPGLRRILGRQGSALIKSGAFSVEEMRKDLVTSLHELKTDRIDIYLLHEGTLEDCTPELHAALAEEVSKGTIGAWGIGTEVQRAQRIVAENPAFCDVVQFFSSAQHPHTGLIPKTPNGFRITHGAFDGFPKLKAYLEADAGKEAQQWSKDIDVDCSNPGILAGLMLNHAVRSNPGGIVLFSSVKPRNIESNVQSVVESPFVPAQIERFGALAAEYAARHDTASTA